MNKNSIITISVIIIAVVFFLVGSRFGGRSSTTGAPNGAVSAAPAIPYPSSPDGMLHFFSGTITSIGDSSITVRGLLPGATKTSSVVIKITTGTTIVQQIQKDSATLQKEMDAYQKQLRTSTTGTSSVAVAPITPPMPFTSKTITAADLTANMFVSATPVANTKQDATAFEATRISAQVLAAAPMAPISPVASTSVSYPTPPPQPVYKK